jgi:hypothetical protein
VKDVGLPRAISAERSPKHGEDLKHRLAHPVIFLMIQTLFAVILIMIEDKYAFFKRIT